MIKTFCETSALGKRLSDSTYVLDVPEEIRDEIKRMLKEQRKLAQIGGKPCEWDEQQWIEWNMKESEG